MKKCPTCDKTFADEMKFCQTDGTPLVEVSDAVEVDPFKTMVARKEEISSSLPPDPFKTMVAPPPKKMEKDVLELPEEPDFLKTAISVPQAGEKSEPMNEKKEKGVNVSPPSPFGDAMPDVLNSESSDERFASSGDETSAVEEVLPQPDSGYSPVDDSASRSSYDNPASPPIPSPFEESMLGYDAPQKPFPPFNEPQPMPFGDQNQFDQSPFDQPLSPLREAEIKAEAFNTPYAEQVEQQQPPEQSNWMPPAPDASWQNQEIGQNTPFQPPAAGKVQNQTLAIVSLVCGILSLACCWFVIPGIAAIVTGIMAKNKAEQNPNEYGGRGLALGGIITGAISLLLGIVLVIIQIFFGALGGILGNM